MPLKNTIRQYTAPAFYHVYNRGANKQPIFLDESDKKKFLSLLARYIDKSVVSKDNNGHEYAKYDITVVAYCLMDNHFHLLVFQPADATAITQLLKSVSTAYTMYFNKKYKRLGHLFQGVFRASLIRDEAYLLHISRYIHINPRDYITHPWSSVAYFLGAVPPNWLQPDLVEDINPVRYKAFLKSYEGRRKELAFLKEQLADS